MINFIKLCLALCLLSIQSNNAIAQNYTCTQIGNQTHCNQNSKPLDMTGKFQNQVDGAAIYDTYLKAQQRALDQREQQMRMDLLKQQQAQLLQQQKLLNNSQQQEPVYLGSDPNNPAYEKTCGTDCCMYAGISKGMGNAKAFSVLSEKLKITGYSESSQCKDTINHYVKWGSEIANKTAVQLTSQDLETISIVKYYEDQF